LRGDIQFTLLTAVEGDWPTFRRVRHFSKGRDARFAKIV